MNRRVVAGLAALALMSTATVFSAQARTAVTAPVFHDGYPMIEMGKVVGDSFNLEPPPAGQTPAQRANWLVNERPALGRTPASWLDWSHTAFSLDPSALAPLRVADLTTEVLRTQSLVGATPAINERASLDAQAAALPPVVRTELASLVATVNDAYAAQTPLALAIAARLDAGFDPHNPAMTVADRDATTARQQAIVAALARFKAVALPLIQAMPNAPLDAPLFQDSEGLIILGNVGNGTYTRSGNFPDPVLLIEPGGSDIYNNSAGGACPVTPALLGGKWLQCNLLVISVVADLGTSGSDDQYTYNSEPAAVQGAGGPGGIGILVDVAGNDRYDATMTRGTINPLEPVLYYLDGGAQGYGYAGAGLLLDGTGNDYYRFAVNSTAGRSIWALAQGFGGAGGIGIASDGAGSDQWIGQGLGITGGSGGFEGMYNQGVGFYAGVGIITDTGLAGDTYSGTVSAPTTDYYAQGFGAFGGLGLQADDGGNDSYLAKEVATASWINPLLNCAFGTGSYAGLGIMLEGGGNDIYVGNTTSNRSASVDDWGAGHPGVSYGLFVDGGGSDRYDMTAVSTGGGTHTTGGLGYWEPKLGNIINSPLGENTFGTFLDLGGAMDTYIGAPWAANNSQWAFGADR